MISLRGWGGVGWSVVVVEDGIAWISHLSSQVSVDELSG